MASPIIDPAGHRPLDADPMPRGAGAHGYPRIQSEGPTGDASERSRALVDEYGHPLSGWRGGRGDGGWNSRRTTGSNARSISWQQALAGTALLGTGALLLWRSRQHAADRHYEAGYRDSSRAAREGVRGSWGGVHETWDRARNRVAQATHALRDGAEQLTAHVSERATRATEAASEGAHAIGRSGETFRDEAQRRYDASAEHARHQYRGLKSSVETLLKEQPLVVGAVGVAVGAAIGSLAPSTRREDAWLGGVRDDVVGLASRAVAQKAEDLREQAADVLGPLKDDRSESAPPAVRTEPGGGVRR